MGPVPLPLKPSVSSKNAVFVDYETSPQLFHEHVGEQITTEFLYFWVTLSFNMREHMRGTHALGHSQGTWDMLCGTQECWEGLVDAQIHIPLILETCACVI